MPVTDSESYRECSFVIILIFADLPTAPFNIQLVQSMPESIWINWTAPRQPGSSHITKYLMELLRPNGTNTMSNYTLSHSDPILEYNFTNLLPNTKYGIHISAYNVYGKGPRSILVEYTTAQRLGGKRNTSYSKFLCCDCIPFYR